MESFSLPAAIPSLERNLTRDASEIDELLCEFYAEQSDDALIDQAVEYNNPSVQFRYLLTLAHIMGGETEEHFVTAYASYHFAISLTRLLGWSVPGPHAAMSDFDYIPKEADYEQARVLLLARAEEYLANRPELASVIGAYSTDYVCMPDGSFANEAQAICALTCERIEQYGIAKLQSSN